MRHTSHVPFFFNAPRVSSERERPGGYYELRCVWVIRVSSHRVVHIGHV